MKKGHYFGWTVLFDPECDAMKNRFKKKCSVNDDISVLGLSTRVENVLKKNNLACVGDVLTSKRIMYLPYLGEKSRKELRRALLDNNLPLKRETFAIGGRARRNNVAV